MLPLLEAEARERQATSGLGQYGGQPLRTNSSEGVGKAVEKAGQAVGVGQTSVRIRTKVLASLPYFEAEARERQRGGRGGILLSPTSGEANGKATEQTLG